MDSFQRIYFFDKTSTSLITWKGTSEEYRVPSLMMVYTIDNLRLIFYTHLPYITKTFFSYERKEFHFTPLDRLYFFYSKKSFTSIYRFIYGMYLIFTVSKILDPFISGSRRDLKTEVGREEDPGWVPLIETRHQY